MHRRVIAAASLLVLLLVPAKARAQAPVQDQAFRGDIDKLLEVTGAAQMGKQAGELVTQQIFAAFKKERSDIPRRSEYPQRQGVRRDRLLERAPAASIARQYGPPHAMYDGRVLFASRRNRNAGWLWNRDHQLVHIGIHRLRQSSLEPGIRPLQFFRSGTGPRARHDDARRTWRCDGSACTGWDTRCLMRRVCPSMG